MPDISKLKPNFEKASRELSEKISEALYKIGEEMHQDIITTNASSHSPSWQSAIHQNGPYQGEQYFKQPSKGGLLEIIAMTKESMISVTTKKNIVTLGFGHIPTLDAMTDSASGPWWRLFERDVDDIDAGGTPGTREGGSENHSFLPIPGTGKRGEGYMIKTKQAIPHPGVLGVNLFGDEFLYYRPLIKERIGKAISDALKAS